MFYSPDALPVAQPTVSEQQNPGRFDILVPACPGRSGHWKEYMLHFLGMCGIDILISVRFRFGSVLEKKLGFGSE